MSEPKVIASRPPDNYESLLKLLSEYTVAEEQYKDACRDITSKLIELGSLLSEEEFVMLCHFLKVPSRIKLQAIQVVRQIVPTVRIR